MQDTRDSIGGPAGATSHVPPASSAPGESIIHYIWAFAHSFALLAVKIPSPAGSIIFDTFDHEDAYAEQCVGGSSRNSGKFIMIMQPVPILSLVTVLTDSDDGYK